MSETLKATTMREKNWNIDRGLLYTTLLLTALGLVMVYNTSLQYSAAKFGSPHYLFYKQLVWALLGIVVLFFVIQFPLRFLRKGWVILCLMMGMLGLLAVPFILAPIKGTHRWIHIGGFSLQPSELSKIVLLVFLAWYLAHHEDVTTRPLRHIVRMGAVVGAFMGLIVLEPDLGNTVIVAALTGIIWFFAGIPLRYLATTAALAIVLLVGVVLVSPYMQKRIKTYLNPTEQAHELGRNYQINQSLIAVGHSGFWGMGLGQSTQKLFFLPEPHTDFVYAVVAEEIGFPGCALLAGLFLYLFIRGVKTSCQSPNLFSRWLGIGLVSVLMIQSLINTSMVIALGPTKGIALPFISMGGTSLLLNLVSMGLVINISRETEAK